MKVSCSKTGETCVNKWDPSGAVTLQAVGKRKGRGFKVHRVNSLVQWRVWRRKVETGGEKCQQG